MSEQRFARARAAIGIACGLLVTSCMGAEQASGDNKAGGDAEPLVLRMANTASSFQYEPAIGYFAERVEELSRGSIHIAVTHEFGDFAPEAEQIVVDAVATGDVDVSAVGVRVLDTVGVGALAALSAPMLIDSYPLQAAVIDGDIADDMLAELSDADLAGISLLASGLRKPIAVERPLLSPLDFEGITFASYRSATYAASIAALGAAPIEAFGPSRLAGLNAGEIDGFDMSLQGLQQLELSWIAPYVALNVNLWAAPIVLIANPDTLEGLTDEQRGWVLQAGDEASVRSIELADADAEAELVEPLCDAGSRFANASADDLAAFHAAFEPLYESLAEDEQTAQFTERIEELKGTIDAGPELDIPAECSSQADLAVPSSETAATSDPDQRQLDGVYRWTVTEEDARANGYPPLISADFLEWYPMVGTMTLGDGTWELQWRGGNGAQATDGPGTYTVDGDELALEFPQDAEVDLRFTFAVDSDGNVELEPASNMAPDTAFVFAQYVWERID